MPGATLLTAPLKEEKRRHLSNLLLSQHDTMELPTFNWCDAKSKMVDRAGLVTYVTKAVYSTPSVRDH